MPPQTEKKNNGHHLTQKGKTNRTSRRYGTAVEPQFSGPSLSSLSKTTSPMAWTKRSRAKTRPGPRLSTSGPSGTLATSCAFPGPREREEPPQNCMRCCNASRSVPEVSGRRWIDANPVWDASMRPWIWENNSFENLQALCPLGIRPSGAHSE